MRVHSVSDGANRGEAWDVLLCCAAVGHGWIMDMTGLSHNHHSSLDCQHVEL